MKHLRFQLLEKQFVVRLILNCSLLSSSIFAIAESALRVSPLVRVSWCARSLLVGIYKSFRHYLRWVLRKHHLICRFLELFTFTAIAKLGHAALIMALVVENIVSFEGLSGRVPSYLVWQARWLRLFFVHAPLCAFLDFLSFLQLWNSLLGASFGMDTHATHCRAFSVDELISANARSFILVW